MACILISLGTQILAPKILFSRLVHSAWCGRLQLITVEIRHRGACGMKQKIVSCIQHKIWRKVVVFFPLCFILCLVMEGVKFVQVNISCSRNGNEWNTFEKFL